MNKFETLAKKSKKQWETLVGSETPIIYLGTASCGVAAGANAVKQAILAKLKKDKINANLIEVGCIGTCYLEPLMDIASGDQPRISYANVKPEMVEEIIDSHIIKNKPLAKKAVGHFGKETLNTIPKFFDLPMLKPQVRLVLKNCGFINPEDISHYIANDGYQGLKKALQVSPQNVIDEITKAGLRGLRR